MVATPPPAAAAAPSDGERAPAGRPPSGASTSGCPASFHAAPAAAAPDGTAALNGKAPAPPPLLPLAYDGASSSLSLLLLP